MVLYLSTGFAYFRHVFCFSFRWKLMAECMHSSIDFFRKVAGWFFCTVMASGEIPIFTGMVCFSELSTWHQVTWRGRILSQVFHMFIGFSVGCELNIKLVTAVLSSITANQHCSLYWVQWLFQMPFSIFPLYQLSDRPDTEVKQLCDSDTEK